MINRPILASIAAVATLWTVILAGDALGAGGVTVSQRGRAFAQRDVQVTRGQVLTFVNDDSFIHQVFIESSAMKFESGEQEPGTTVEIRFPAAGTFEVRCQIHPKMLLRVDVR